jgi:hypothetical protein
MNYSSKIRLTWLAGALAIALTLPTQAATVITGDGLPYTGFSSLSREADRVLQQFYDDTFFSGVTEPTLITAMSFRLPAVADVDYPALGDINFARYDITLAKPSAASATANGLTSATFADNMQDALLVRSGAITIPLGSFESNAANEDAAFSFQFVFNTPYLYTPGDDLVMLVRHDGHGDVNGQETRWNFDGYTWANGSVVSTLNVDDTVGNFGPGSFNLANRIEFTLVPEPATGLLLALGGLAVACFRFRSRA